MPAVNQIELHPRFQQRNLREAHAELGIVTEAWSPLGEGRHLDDPALTAVARKHGRSPAQVVLAWHLAQGIVAIPKSANPARIAENFAALDLSLEPDDLAAVDALDTPDGRTGPDPERFPG